MAALITKPQIRKLWAMARQLGMDKVDVHGLIFNMTGSGHVSTISRAQAASVIDYLTDRQKKQYRPEMASRRQLWKIQQLAKELGWENNPKRLLGFVRKYAQVESLKWLDARAAYQIIEGLKKLLKRSGAVAGSK